ncbi:MAG TPA: pentapeptide repeat-containing protein [Phycicoccus sp.]|nr:pentapeptide repeat-containing protein [Phycicoccus sp.]
MASSPVTALTLVHDAAALAVSPAPAVPEGRAVVRLTDIAGYAAGLSIEEGLDPHEVVRGLDLDGCTLTGVSLSEARLLGCTFVECRFESVDLSMTDLTDSRFTGCTFVGSRMLALGWASTSSSPVFDPNHFEDCRMEHASFAGSDVTAFTFRRCRLREADFTEAVARRVDFAGSDLAAARFDRTDLRDASLAGATGWVLDPRTNTVRGLRIDLDGAAGLLDPLGVHLT